MSQDSSKRRGIVSRRKFAGIAGALGVGGLAGCIGNDDSSSSDGTVQLVADTDLKPIADKYNQWLHEAGMPDDISVEVLSGSDLSQKRRNQYNQWLSSGRSKPDVLMMDCGWTNPFVARGQTLNLSDAAPDLASTVDDSFFDMSVDTTKDQEGNLHGVPVFPGFPTMQYRKDLLREVGYSDSDFETWSTESMNWAQFSQITKEAKQEADTEYGFTFQFRTYGGTACCDFNEFLSSFGGAYFGDHDNLFGPVGDRPITVDQQPVIDSLRMLRRFVYGDSGENALTELPATGEELAGEISPEAVLQWAEEPSRKPFTNGKAVMHRNWTYSININGSEENFGEDLGVMPIPYMPPHEYSGAENVPYEGTNTPEGPVAALGGWHYTVNPNSNKTEDAIEFLRAATSESVQLKLFQEVGWLPPRPDLLDSSEAQEVPIMGRYLDTLKKVGQNAVSRPVTVAWPTQTPKVAQEANAALAKDKSPAQAMTDLKSSLQQIEQRFSE